MSQDIVPICLGTSSHDSGPTVGLVVARGVEGQFTDELTVLVQNLHPETVDEYQDPSARESAAQPDVVKP